MMMNIRSKLAIGLLSFSTLAIADEYPVIGKVYEIKEPSLLEAIYEKLEAKKASGELDKLQKEFTDRAVNTFKNPPGTNLSIADANRERKFDPSIVLQRNLYMPDGRILYPAGTKVNPLQIRKFSKRLIFIDGRIEEQRQYAVKLHKESGYLDKIILVNGSPYEFMKKNKVRAFFDQTIGGNGRRKITPADQLEIQKTPSVVYQKNPNDLYLTIEEVNLNEIKK